MYSSNGCIMKIKTNLSASRGLKFFVGGPCIIRITENKQI